MSAKRNKQLERVQDIFMDYGTALSDLFGLSHAMTRIVAFLYTSPAPVSPSEICRRLELTKGTVSVYLRLLEEKGVVVQERLKQRGRGKAYTINVQLWKVLHDRMLEYARLRVRLTEDVVDEGLAVLNEAKGDDEELKVIRERVESMQKLNDFSRQIIEGLPALPFSTDEDDAGRLKKISIKG